MSFEEFAASVPAGKLPELPKALQALWYDRRGDWDHAHDAAQEDKGAAGAWVHGYRHRKEGDSGNAAYWYSRARRPYPDTSLDQEWEAIARELLAD